MSVSTLEELVLALTKQALPLIAADGGVLYLVEASQSDVHLHLSGTCAGCPGTSLTIKRLLEPVVRTVSSDLVLRVTTGWDAPEGATRVG